MTFDRDTIDFRKNTDTAYNAKKVAVVFERLPSNLEELKASYVDFKNPHRIVALVVAVLHGYSENKENCIEMLDYLCGPRPICEYDIEYITDRLKVFPYLINSYFDGAIPENNYNPSLPYTVYVYESDENEIIVGEGFRRMFIKSGGSNNARGVKLRYKASSGEWFLWDYLIFADISRPIADDPWA